MSTMVGENFEIPKSAMAEIDHISTMELGNNVIKYFNETKFVKNMLFEKKHAESLEENMIF